MCWKNIDQDLYILGLRQAKANKKYVGGTGKRSR